MSAFAAIIGTSTVIRHVQHMVLKAAEHDTPVMVTGEPGAGKEMVARAIHEKSSRSAGAFVPVKCAAIAEDLLESELFGMARPDGGHRPGRFEVANGGTVYLDELAKIPQRAQASLMRLLVEGVVIPVGGREPVAVNVRLICASAHALDELVRERIVREDLYYRFASSAVYLPPLRERREDIPLLVEYYVEKFNHQKGKNIIGASPDAMTALLQHNWTHNCRELENLIERIVVLKNTGSVEVSDLPPRIRDLVTSNIDSFYERTQSASRDLSRSNANNASGTSPVRTPGASFSQQNYHAAPQNIDVIHSPSKTLQAPIATSPYGSAQQSYTPPSSPTRVPSYEEASDIDQFVKKEIDLGNGIDFYRVVEEFENRLIAEALRRTNHNKNRAAQLLSMNRTTLVEKLKKRTSSTGNKSDGQRVKRNSAFTIFDSLGDDDGIFSNVDFMTKEDTDLLASE